jgi:hypothetical protein
LLIPWAKKIDARESNIFYAPPGSGRTAFIQMARYRHHINSSSPALSLYLNLQIPVDKDEILRLFARALAEALSCAVMENPFWLLATEQDAQSQVAALLLYWAGGHEPLIRRLKRRGLQLFDRRLDKDLAEPAQYEGQLLTELFYRFDSLKKLDWEDVIAAAHVTQDALSRFAVSALFETWSYPIFLWIDSHIPDQDKSERTAHLLWRNDYLRRLGHLKMFTSHNFGLPDLIGLSWDRYSLRAMLDHRLTYSKKDKNWLNRQFNSLKYQSEARDSYEWVLDQSKVPADVIRNGNRLLEAVNRQD